jgi:RND family efflux transporter MFP subunit
MAKANLTNMESNYKRLEKLRNDKAIPEKMWDDIQAGVSAAKGQLEQVQGLVNLANSQVSDARIVATIDGIIAKKHIDQGEVVVSAQMMKQAPIVTIVDMDVVKVLIGITEKDIEKIKKGMDAEVTVDAWPGKVFHGKVTNIAPIVNPMNRTIEVELQIENRSGALKPGMFARVQIITDVHENSVLIPLDAVIDSESGKNVFVVEGQKAVRRDIKTGFLESTRLEVTNGLKGGEELVVLGQQRLKDGVKVKSQPIQSLGGIK